MEQSDEKAKQVYAAATACELNAEEVIDEIADSMEIANKIAKTPPSQDDTSDPYLRWWYSFLKEWNHKCFVRWLDKCGDSKDYQRMENLWLSSFETLWVLGCEMVRNVRLNELREGVSRVISRESPSKTDVEEIWRWHNENAHQLDEAALKMLDLLKEHQRQAIKQTLKELREYDKDSLFGKLKRLISK